MKPIIEIGDLRPGWILVGMETIPGMKACLPLMRRAEAEALRDALNDFLEGHQ